MINFTLVNITHILTISMPQNKANPLLWHISVFTTVFYSHIPQTYISVQCIGSVLWACLTLHVWFSDTSMFLAARSLCTNDFAARYSIPEAMSWQKSSSFCDRLLGEDLPGLGEEDTYFGICCKWMQFSCMQSTIYIKLIHYAQLIPCVYYSLHVLFMHFTVCDSYVSC